MQDSEQSILNIFKANPAQDYSTTRLAKEFFREEYALIEKDLSSVDKIKRNNAKRRKFQLHRKLLYYLHKLVDQNILKVSHIEEKGEKTFALAIEDGEMLLEKGYRKIVISKPALPSNHIEQYEMRKIMKKYEEDSFVTRFNSILLECSKMQNAHKLHQIVCECINSVNDTIALNDFEIMTNQVSECKQEIFSLIDKLAAESDNLGKTISLLINISECNPDCLEQFIKHFSHLNPKRVNIIFNTTHKIVQKNSHVFETIIDEFSKNKIKLNIKNDDLHAAPYFTGRAGTYTFEDAEWQVYKDSAYPSTIGACCCQSAIAINVNKYFEDYTTDSEFRNAVLKAAKVLLSANTIQRRKSNEYFRDINTLNAHNPSAFYRFSRNYIRFWNYDWHKDIEGDTNLLELIKSSKELVDQFCYSEETIYKSCGIPIRFRIAFSSAFRNFDPKFMGEREYRKVNLKRIEDFYQGEIRNFIYAREKLFEIFDGGDRLRIFRSAAFRPLEVMHEIMTLLGSFKIPFFTYDFSVMKGTVKLTNFM